MIKVLIASSKTNQRWSEKIWEQIIWSDHEMRAKVLTYDTDDEKRVGMIRSQVKLADVIICNLEDMDDYCHLVLAEAYKHSKIVFGYVKHTQSNVIVLAALSTLTFSNVQELEDLLSEMGE